MKTIIASAGLAVLLAVGGAGAQEAATTAEPAAPAEDAAPIPAVRLSEVLAPIEAEDRFGYIDNIQWNESQGYWTINYRRTDGARITLEIDAATGQPRMD